MQRQLPCCACKDFMFVYECITRELCATQQFPCHLAATDDGLLNVRTWQSILCSPVMFRIYADHHGGDDLHHPHDHCRHDLRRTLLCTQNIRSGHGQTRNTFGLRNGVHLGLCQTHLVRTGQCTANRAGFHYPHNCLTCRGPQGILHVSEWRFSSAMAATMTRAKQR